MTIYRRSPQFLHQRQRRFLLTFIPISILVFGWGMFRGASKATLASLLFTALISLTVIILTIALGIRSVFKQYRRHWSSYQLILTEDSVTCIQDGFQNVRYFREDIQKIVEIRGRGLLIHGFDRPHKIWIPETLENFGNVRNSLEHWQPIESATLNFWVIGLSSLVVGFGPFVAIYLIAAIVKNKFITIASLTIYLVFLLSCVLLMRRNPNIDRYSKSRIGWLIFPLLSIVGVIIILLFV